jgi:hypothetical protein
VNNSFPYRIARFHVGRNARRRGLWVRYKTAPGRLALYAIGGSLVGLTVLYGLLGLYSLFPAVFRHLLGIPGGSH